MFYCIRWFLNLFHSTTRRKEKCTCGQEKEWCKSYMYINSNGSFGRENLFQCGKTIKTINEIRKQYNR